MSAKSNGGDTMENYQETIATIKAEVLEQVMVELRPLLVQLAEMASVKTVGPKSHMPSAKELQEQAQAQLESMKLKMAERIALRQAHFAQRMKRRKGS
jgi:hypothetical protein